MNNKYQDRIGYKGDITPVLNMVCENYNLGNYKSHEAKIVGYEDFNLFLVTTTGKYFVKIFAKFRSHSDCERYIDILTAIDKTDVNTPKLYKHENGYLLEIHHDNHEFRLCVMEYIEGKSFFDLRTLPNEEEKINLIKQATTINRIQIKPKFEYDSWATVNFLKEYSKKNKYLSQSDKELVDPLVKEFKSIDIDKLPHCFVHGDLISTNVLRDKNGKLYIIDFAVANYYPRIVELAVLFCNILFDNKNTERTIKNYKTALEEYRKNISLDKTELKHLPSFVKFAHAMHIINGTYERVVQHNDTEENNYWIELGRAGLKSNCPFPQAR